MMTFDITAQAAPLYWGTIAILVAAGVSLAIEALPREVATLRNRFFARRRARFFVAGNVARASA